MVVGGEVVVVVVGGGVVVVDGGAVAVVVGSMDVVGNTEVGVGGMLVVDGGFGVVVDGADLEQLMPAINMHNTTSAIRAALKNLYTIASFLNGSILKPVYGMPDKIVIKWLGESLHCYYI